MCRLFAYVHGGSALPLSEAVDASSLEEFRSLAVVHRDGWGAASIGPAGRSFYLASRSAADDAAAFAALVSQSVNSLIIHERLASPGIGLVFENQQPFMLRDVAFGHNGTIGNADGNVVDRPQAYREALGLERSTTRSDSRLYGELFAQSLDRQGPRNATAPRTPEALASALSSTIRLLRRDYPDASYNSVIQTDDYTIVTRAHAEVPICSPGLRRIYEAAGWGNRIGDYYDIRYERFTRADGTASCVASSSGYPASDAWDLLPNNHMLFIAHRAASLRIVPLGE